MRHLLCTLIASTLIAIAALLTQGCTRSDVGPAEAVAVILETDLGNILLEVYPQAAPASADDFLRYVDAGRYRNAGFYRVVRPDNDNGAPAISVIQGGLLDEENALAPIPHETTERTGLLHRDGVLSIARAEPGTGSAAAFFIVIGDQPSLDYGGARNPDGQGFATFGRVVAGMDVVRRINALQATASSDDPYTAGQILGRHHSTDVIRRDRFLAMADDFIRPGVRENHL